jgi:hypothetical protein
MSFAYERAVEVRTVESARRAGQTGCNEQKASVGRSVQGVITQCPANET